MAYSRADNLFWNDIMMEHALFFVQLMPGADLEPIRLQAANFNQLFARQFEMSRSITGWRRGLLCTIGAISSSSAPR